MGYEGIQLIKKLQLNGKEAKIRNEVVNHLRLNNLKKNLIKYMKGNRQKNSCHKLHLQIWK